MVAATESILLTSAARADLFLRFRVPVAHVGQTVVAFYGDAHGRPARVTSIAGIHTYLVPARDRISPSHQSGTGPPRNPAWIPLGRLRRTSNGSAMVRVRLPVDLAPGLYTIGFWCIPCAPPKGATFTGAYPNWTWRPGARYQTLLRVVPPKPTGGIVWRAWEIAALAGAALVTLMALYRRGRTRQRDR